MWYGITLSAGLVLMALAIWFFTRSQQFIKNGYRTTATVVELVAVQGKDGTTYKPLFKFKTELNKEITHLYGVSSSPPMWDEGESLEIIYDPNNPDSMKPISYFGLYGISVILFAVAMPPVIIGLGYFIFSNNFH